MRLQSPILLTAAALAIGLLPMAGCAGTNPQGDAPADLSGNAFFDDTAYIGAVQDLSLIHI